MCNRDYMMDCIPNMRGFDDMDAPTTRAYVDAQGQIPQGIVGRPYRFVARLDADGEILGRTYLGESALLPFVEQYVGGRCDYSERERAEGRGARMGEGVTIYRIVDGEEIPWRTVEPDAAHPLGIHVAPTTEQRTWERDRAKRNAARRAEIEAKIADQIAGRYGATMRPGDIAREVRAALREERTDDDES